MDITVAGAGALGLASALALADAGCAVTVFDPAPGGEGASGVAAGMLAPVFEAALDEAAFPHFDLLLAARDLWPALESRAGVVLDRSGALAAGSPDFLRDVRAAMGRLGLRSIELPHITAQALAPGLSPRLDVLMTREDWRLDPAQALAALRAAAQAAGVAFRAERAPLEAPRLVIATGACQSLAERAPQLSALSPIKGHILTSKIGGAGGITVRGEGVYAVPTAGGLKIGATMEAGVSDVAVDPAKAQPLVEAGARLFPAVASAPHSLAAGVRAATPDGLPMVGATDERTVVAVGTRRNGWLLAALIARAVVAAVLDQEPPPHAARLDPRRFNL